jgi:hypothetical protein
VLGVVGDLGDKRIIAWEITPDTDVLSLEAEVKLYRPEFEAEGLTTDALKFCVCQSLGHANMGDYIYFDLWREDGIRTAGRREFFKRFKRAF